jgi:two-component system cell cycle sensor histidine kinase/response regulator CckA
MSGSNLPETNHGPVDELRRQLTALKAEVHSQQWLVDALESQSAQYRALFELMPGCVLLIDSRGYIRDANPYFCRSFCYTRDELVGMHVTQITREKPEAVERNISRMLSGEVLHHEVTNVQKDGSVRFYELRETAVTLPDGSMNILAVSTDITDRKRGEQRIIEQLHAQQLESLGALAGGIAHGFNNLLAVMLSNVEMAMLGLPANAPMQPALADAVAAGRRAAELMRQMFAFSGRGHFVLTEIDLNGLVCDLKDSLKAAVSKSARLEFETGADLPRISADAVHVRQILMNLATNASEAIGEAQGVVTISATVRDCDAAQLAATRTANPPPPGRYVALEVKDNGCGMDEKVRARLFDPFFTTRFIGRGLGMSAVLSIVQGHHGAILVASEPGRGTTISILFPVAAVQKQPPAGGKMGKLATAKTSRPLSLSGTMLIGNDEGQMRCE